MGLPGKSKYYSPQKEPELLGEMANSRAKLGKAYNKSGTSYTRKHENSERLIGIFQNYKNQRLNLGQFSIKRVITIDYNPFNKTGTHELNNTKIDRYIGGGIGNFYLTVECQIINVEKMMEQMISMYKKIFTVKIVLIKEQKWILIQMTEGVIRNRILTWSQSISRQNTHSITLH